MSKLILPAILAAAGSFVISLSAQDLPPTAAKPAAPVKASPTAPVAPVAPDAPTAPVAPVPLGDPFVRDRRAPQAVGIPGARAEVATPVNLLSTLETWSLSQADFAALLDGPVHEAAPYEHLEELAKAGKAKLIGLMALSTKSGQRAVVELIDEVRYASEFKGPERVDEIPFPSSWETRNTGETLEIEPILGPDGKTIDVQLVPQVVRLEGFQDWQPEASAAPTSTPQFHTEKVTTGLSLQSGRPAFLAAGTPAAATEAQSGNPIRVRVLRVTAQPAALAPPIADGPVNARVELLLYSMKREAARRILNETGDSVQSYTAVRDLITKGEAQLETVSAFILKSGQRAVNEDISEFRYPTGMNAPSFQPGGSTSAETRRPASAHAFETRAVGVTVEIEPTFGPEGRSVDIAIVPQIVRFGGNLQVTGVAAKYPQQPVFTTRKVTTSVSSSPGAPVLLGTLSKPSDTGVNDRKDDGRTSLAYIRVTPVRP